MRARHSQKGGYTMTKLIRRFACTLLALILLASVGYAEKQQKEITVGSLTQMSGNFFTDCWGNNSADMDVRELIHGYSTVAMFTNGHYGIDETVGRAYPNEDEGGNMVYTFYISSRMKWSDGTPITAADYVFTVLLLSSPEFAALGANATDYAHIVGQDEYLAGTTDMFAGVHLIDDTTFSLAIKAEYLPSFHELMLVRVMPSPMFVIAPDCEIRDDGEGAYIAPAENTDGQFTTELLHTTLLDPETGYCSHPSVTCGAYKLVSYEDNVAVFEKNEYYRGNYERQKPRIDRITFKQVFNETLLDELKNGAVDLVNKVSSADVIDAAKDEKGVKSRSYARDGLAFLAFACENEPVSSAKVRKAIDRLVDVDALCEEYLGGYGEPVYGYYGNGQWMIKQIGKDKLEKKLNLYPYDVDAAIALLEEDGWLLEDGAQVRTKDGTELVINWVRPEVSEVADALEAMLTENFAKAGIGLNVTKMTYEELSKYYYRQEDRSEYDMFFLASNFGLTFNAYPAVALAPEMQGVWNTTAIADPELEALANDMNATKNGYLDSYAEKWLAFQEKWVDDLPMVPLYSNEYSDLFSTAIEDYKPKTHYSWASAILYATKTAS